jgi:hypothetical protein
VYGAVGTDGVIKLCTVTDGSFVIEKKVGIAVVVDSKVFNGLVGEVNSDAALLLIVWHAFNATTKYKAVQKDRNLPIRYLHIRIDHAQRTMIA